MFIKIEIKLEGQKLFEVETIPEYAPTPKTLATQFPAQSTVTYSDITYYKLLEGCIGSRKEKYPTPEDFLNAWFDGGIDDLELRRMAIKATYPKPTFSEKFAPITIELKEDISENEDVLPFGWDNE